MKKIAYILLAASAAVGVATPASAQGIPVIDPSNIAQTVRVVQNGVQQVQTLQQQLSEVTNLRNTLGQLGEGQIRSILSDVGLNFDQVQNPLGQLRGSLPGILDALPTSQIGQQLNIPAGLAQQAKTNIEAGRNFAIQAFFARSNASTDEIAARSGIRQAAARDSATAGYALAVYAKNDLENVEETMRGLTQRISSSTDLRTDVQGNTAVALAQLRQATVTNQLLAQLLEVNAASSIADSPTGTGASSGGSN